MYGSDSMYVTHWREVADIVEQIGHMELSYSLRQVYVTGKEMEMRSRRMCGGSCWSEEL